MKILLIILSMLLFICQPTDGQSPLDNSKKGYVKIHFPGISISPTNYSLSAGGSFGSYLGETFALGIGGTLYTYEQQATLETFTGGGTALYIETVIDPTSHNLSYTFYTGTGFLNYEYGDETTPIGKHLKYPLLGIGIDYSLGKILLGTRFSYSFIKIQEATPQVRILFSIGTRF